MLNTATVTPTLQERPVMGDLGRPAPTLPPFDPWRTSVAALEVGAATLASADVLAQLRMRRWRALLTSVAQRSALYREFTDGRHPASLQPEDLPIVRKDELMSRFSDWVIEPTLSLSGLQAFVQDPSQIGQPYQGRYLVWESSGSSGEPGIFVQDAASLAVYDALEALRRRVLWHGADSPVAANWWDRRTAFVGATNGHFASTLSVERLRRLNPFMARTLHSVSFLQPVDKLAAELQGIAPQVLATYPSVAVMLAEAQLAGRLHMDLNEVCTGGETLTDAMRACISQAFGCEVINSYGASEFMSLAFECQHRKLHLHSDWAILEPIDEAGRPVPAGQTGASVLLTNLANTIQPIIRYDLGDRVAMLEGRCACGSHLPVIEVHGRSGDLMRLKGAGSNVDACVSEMALSTVLESVAGLSDFQLIQLGRDAFELRTELGGADADAILHRAESALLQYLDGQGAGAMRITCHSARACRRTRNGKVKRVIPMTAAH